ETPPEDLLEFVKLLEDKKELNMKPSTILPQQDISSSLIKFQSMKPNNDTLSDNLSMSMSID
nr:Chain C, Atg13 MIM [Kluyveromyces marxianus]4P1N_D Chain D, Atg13 MIM [Kluyveromyces marxianus]